MGGNFHPGFESLSLRHIKGLRSIWVCSDWPFSWLKYKIVTMRFEKWKIYQDITDGWIAGGEQISVAEGCRWGFRNAGLKSVIKISLITEAIFFPHEKIILWNFMGIGDRLIKCVVWGMKIISGGVMTITKKYLERPLKRWYSRSRPWPTKKLNSLR